MISTTRPEKVFCAVAVDDLDSVLKYGIRRKSLGWEDREPVCRHQPIRTFIDQIALEDQTGPANVKMLEVEMPPNTPYEARGYSWYLHANIEPSWIKNTIEYSRRLERENART